MGGALRESPRRVKTPTHSDGYVVTVSKGRCTRRNGTTEVCAVRVGSAGSDICDISKELANKSENLARSLQNLHRGFDSRRRLSFEQIATSSGSMTEVGWTSVVRPSLARRISLALARGTAEVRGRKTEVCGTEVS